MPTTCTALGTSPKTRIAISVGTITPSFMNIEESTMPLVLTFHCSSMKLPI